MSKRGPKTGSTREGSLASKLLNIREGECVGIQDNFVSEDGENPIQGPSIMERAVQNMLSKNEVLRGRRFSTQRSVVVLSAMAGTMHMLIITRHFVDPEEGVSQ